MILAVISDLVSERAQTRSISLLETSVGREREGSIARNAVGRWRKSETEGTAVSGILERQAGMLVRDLFPSFFSQQYDSDKARFAATERTYQEQLGGRQRDLQAAQQKLQELQAQCNQFSAQSRQAQDQLLTFRKALEQAPNPTQIQQLRDENQRLKEHLARNEYEFCISFPSIAAN